MLAAAQELAGLHNIFVAGFGTDGTDGPTDVAGALVDGLTVEQAEKKGIDISQFLNNHDSYNFFKKVGGHIIPVPPKPTSTISISCSSSNMYIVFPPPL